MAASTDAVAQGRRWRRRKGPLTCELAGADPNRGRRSLLWGRAGRQRASGAGPSRKGPATQGTRPGRLPGTAHVIWEAVLLQGGEQTAGSIQAPLELRALMQGHGARSSSRTYLCGDHTRRSRSLARLSGTRGACGRPLPCPSTTAPRSVRAPEARPPRCARCRGPRPRSPPLSGSSSVQRGDRRDKPGGWP